MVTLSRTQILALVWAHKMSVEEADELLIRKDVQEDRYWAAILVDVGRAGSDVNNRVNTRLYIVLGVYAVLTAVFAALIPASDMRLAKYGSVFLVAITSSFAILWRTEHLKVKEIQEWLQEVAGMLEQFKPDYISHRFQLFEAFSKDIKRKPTHTMRNQLFAVGCAVAASIAFFLYQFR